MRRDYLPACSLASAAVQARQEAEVAAREKAAADAKVLALLICHSTHLLCLLQSCIVVKAVLPQVSSKSVSCSW